jgi:hypothetical protein
MSVAIRFERLIPSAITEPTTPYLRHHAEEAPDCGGYHAEAPESDRGRSQEAPDASHGRSHCVETYFTHGRSQS